VQNLSYTYDAVGNITHIQDDAQQTIYFQNARIDPSNDYVYDALYRLVSASGREDALLNAPPAGPDGPPQSVPFPVTGDTLRNYSEFYQYDSVGNIERLEHVANTNGQGAWTRFYEYATDSNRLLRTWHGDPDWDSGNAKDKTTYLYDTHGNMLNIAPVSARQFFNWNYRDMIANIDLVGGGLAFYNYDSSKQRRRKRIDKQDNSNGFWERIYFEGFELYRRYSGETPVEEIESHHIYEGEQRVLLVDDVITTDLRGGSTMKTGPIFRYQYGNHQGSACLELDEQAEIVSYEEYHPYGTSSYRARKDGIEIPLKRYRYTGMERDEESGLSYHTARYYLPWLGRWASCDPSWIKDGLNIYCYVKDNPVGGVDPSGRVYVSSSKNSVKAVEEATNDELLIVFARLRSRDFISKEREKLLGRGLANAAQYYGRDKDYGKVVRSLIIGQITSGLADPVSQEEIERRESYEGQEFAQAQFEAGLSAAKRGAEATEVIAGLLGTPTSKTDVALMIGIPIVGAVLAKGLKVSKPLLAKIIGNTLGKEGDDAARAFLKTVDAGPLVLNHLGLPFQIWQTDKKLGPAYKTLEEAVAAANGGHHLEVFLKDKKGNVVGHWFEASEKGFESLGHTEQKALTRINPTEGMTLELRGPYPPCPYECGCLNSMQAAADIFDLPIQYTRYDGKGGQAVYHIQPGE
jgi:RHS repeat-associated protein